MGLVKRLMARLDRIADRDADPAALTARSGSRRPALPAPLEPPAPPDRSTAHDASGGGPAGDRTELERIRADQHHRMRSRTFGRRVQ